MNRLNVLHLFNQYLPQTENWCYKLLRYTPGTKTYIGARHYLKNDFYDPTFTFVEHPFGAIEAYSARLRRDHFPDLLKKATIKTLKPLIGDARRAITRFARKHPVELVHAHFADVAWRFRDIPKELGKPFVVSFYGWDYEQLPTLRPEFRDHYQQLFKTADAFICEGAHGAGILKAAGCPEEKVKVIPLGIEPQRIPLFQRSKRPGELRLVQIATFNEKKGHLYTVQAFAEAIKTCPNMSLTLVGGQGQDGIKEEVVQFIETNHLQAPIKIIDRIDYRQLYDFLRGYQVFIHPSCYARDRDCEGGAPVVLLDAQATGMPVIATRHCDIPSEVIDGKTGLLAEEKAVDQLARHIRTFYQMDAPEYKAFCREASDHVREHFDIRRNAQALSDVYLSLVKR